MQLADYRPGYSALVMEFKRQHTAETHASFFLPQLQAGWRLLDAGCGPGTITLGLARAVAPGEVIGIDIEDTQFDVARDDARRQGLNVKFQKASVSALPFPDASFDAVFCHALLEHLIDVRPAIAELRRVLKPGGVIGLRGGDIGGLLLDSVPLGTAEAFAANLSNPRLGRQLGHLLHQAGITVRKMTP
jgi:ubiquinone/menaquinone biosynthesis C-methylase UbiE